MALQTSGAISLDQIHVEAGGTTGTTCSLNDTDIRNLNEASGKTINNTQGTTIDFDDFYGATNIPNFDISMTVGDFTQTGTGPNYGSFSSSLRGYVVTNYHGYSGSTIGSVNSDSNSNYFGGNTIKAISLRFASGDTTPTGFNGLRTQVQAANASIANNDNAFKTKRVTNSTGTVTTLNRSDATYSAIASGTDTSLHNNIWEWGSSYANSGTLGADGTTCAIRYSRT
tara:strand:- start:2218 stop:2898 length:681 start_codon:yes stop_codon:yes gene_type:complete